MICLLILLVCFQKNRFINVGENEYDNIISINLKSTYFIIQTVANYMIDKQIRVIY